MGLVGALEQLALLLLCPVSSRLIQFGLRQGAVLFLPGRFALSTTGHLQGTLLGQSSGCGRLRRPDARTLFVSLPRLLADNLVHCVFALRLFVGNATDICLAQDVGRGLDWHCGRRLDDVLAPWLRGLCQNGRLGRCRGRWGWEG